MRPARALSARRAIQAILGLTLAVAFIVGFMPGMNIASATGARVSDVNAALSPATRLGNSADGRISVRVEASPSEVPAGGGEVTFTYTVTNTRESASEYDRYWFGPASEAMFFGSVRTSVCSDISWSGFRVADSGERLLLRGETATGTCKTTVTQDITNTVEANFYSYHHVYSKASASERVTVKYSGESGIGQCDGLWFSSGVSGNSAQFGSVGTIDIKNGFSISSRLNFAQTSVLDHVDGAYYKQRMNGSAAMAVDPSSPNKIYYVPRYTSFQSNGYGVVRGDYYGGLWVYDAHSRKNEIISPFNQTPNTNRLGVSPDGMLWSVDGSGTLQRFDPRTRSWTDLGLVTLGVGPDVREQYTFSTGYSNSLLSGDLTFDGLGNMWLIGSSMDKQIAFLYTISQEDIKNGGPITATMVGNMGPGEFNGIAFGPDGKLYGSTRNTDTGKGALYLIDKKNGQTEKLEDLDFMTEDLGSCSLPKPELNIEKTANPDKAVADGGIIKYTITIQNTGNLEATGVTFEDKLADHKLRYVKDSAKLNGEPWGYGERAIFDKAKAYVKSKNARYYGLTVRVNLS